MSTSSISPSTRNGPSFRTIILVEAIHPPYLDSHCCSPGLSFEEASEGSDPVFFSFLILGHAGIDFVGPCQNPALEVQEFFEAGFLQKLNGVSRAFAAAAMDDHLSRTIQFVHAPREFPERNQFSIQVANLIFMRFAHIEYENIVTAILPRFQILCSNFRNAICHRGSLLTATPA